MIKDMQNVERQERALRIVIKLNCIAQKKWSILS